VLRPSKHLHPNPSCHVLATSRLRPIHPMSHPGAAVFPVNGLLPAIISVALRAPAKLQTDTSQWPTYHLICCASNCPPLWRVTNWSPLSNLVPQLLFVPVAPHVVPQWPTYSLNHLVSAILHPPIGHSMRFQCLLIPELCILAFSRPVTLSSHP